MTRHLRRVEVWSLLLLAMLAAGRADAMCNAIPTADRTFSSAAGAVDRPFASPGRQVKLMLGGPCDGPARFEPEPGRTKVALTFESFDPAVPPRTVVLPPASIVTMMTNELVFAFPDTRELTGQLFTGPVSIRAIVDEQVVVSIDELGTRDASCGALKPHPIFRWFTALPPSNNFHCVAKPLDCHDPDADPTVVRATIDRGGNLLVPWDWSGVFPPRTGLRPDRATRARRAERARSVPRARSALGHGHHHPERGVRELAHAHRGRAAAVSRRRSAERRGAVSGHGARRDGGLARGPPSDRPQRRHRPRGRDLRSALASRRRRRSDPDHVAARARRAARRPAFGQGRRRRHRSRGARQRPRDRRAPRLRQPERSHRPRRRGRGKRRAAAPGRGLERARRVLRRGDGPRDPRPHGPSGRALAGRGRRITPRTSRPAT